MLLGDNFLAKKQCAVVGMVVVDFLAGHNQVVLKSKAKKKEKGDVNVRVFFHTGFNFAPTWF